jgi:hypothetical protein
LASLLSLLFLFNVGIFGWMEADFFFADLGPIVGLDLEYWYSGSC